MDNIEPFNHAPERNGGERRGWNRRVPCAGSLSLGRSARKFMRIKTCLLSLMAIVVSIQGQVPEGYLGDWLLVNGLAVLHIDADGTMVHRNSGERGKIKLEKDGTFIWELTGHSRGGRFSDGKLFLKNDQAGAPKWMSYLEFRRGEEQVASEVIQFAVREQAQTAEKIVSSRRNYIENIILNNLRQLDGAAMQFCLENRVKTLKLDQVVGPDKLIKKLTPVDGEDYSKLDLTEGVRPWKVVSASGVTVTFDR
jgi:hypothetical protein